MCAATLNGVVEFKPPASIETVCVIFRPMKSWSVSKARMISSPRGIFSTITVGAPIIAEERRGVVGHLVHGDDLDRAAVACLARSVPM